jgi:hypothetical protein
MAAQSTAKIYFIRHGEKPKDKSKNDLSKKGKKRMEAMPSLLAKAVGVKTFDNVFSVKPGKIKGKKPEIPKKARPSLTISKLKPKATLLERGRKLAEFEEEEGGFSKWSASLQTTDIFKRLFDNLPESGSFLICWEHHIEAAFIDILWSRSHDGQQNPKGHFEWPKDDYDSIIVFDVGTKEFFRTDENFDGPKGGPKAGQLWELAHYEP